MTARDAAGRVRLACVTPAHRAKWVVTARLCNYSAFNGYHYTPSDYSEVRCPECGARWRSKAGYVAQLPDAPRWPL